ncbi:MAG: DoxX family protein [Gemmatimonadales bacterium]
MSNRSRSFHVALWVVQGLLAALFLFAGGFKLALPAATLAKMAPLPAPFLKFIGLCEVTGALGLVLPGIFRVRTGLTALAAAGLAVIMAGAVVVSIATVGIGAAVVPAVVGTLSLVVVVQTSHFSLLSSHVSRAPVDLRPA